MTAMPETYHNYIDGEWVESETGNTTTLRNPADTGDVIGEFQQSSSDDAARAIEAATAATEHWATTPGPDRGTILRATARRLEDRKDELAETITREEGMVLDEAAGEVQRAADIFYYYAEKARDVGGTRKQASSQNSDLYTVREPMGVVGLYFALGGSRGLSEAHDDLEEVRDHRQDEAGQVTDPIVACITRCQGIDAGRPYIRYRDGEFIEESGDREKAAELLEKLEPKTLEVFDAHTAESTQKLAQKHRQATET